MGGTGGVWDLAAELKETLGDLPVDPLSGIVPDTIGVVRLGDDWWTLASGEWSGPKTVDYVTVLGRSTPVRQVASQFQSLVWAPVEPVDVDEVEGLRVDRYHFVDDPNRMSSAWNALAPELPIEPLPRDASGELEVWTHDSGLVVRLRMHAEDGRGRVFEGRLQLSGFGEPLDIRPPV